jgi:hypothetical protein
MRWTFLAASTLALAGAACVLAIGCAGASSEDHVGAATGDADPDAGLQDAPSKGSESGFWAGETSPWSSFPQCDFDGPPPEVVSVDGGEPLPSVPQVLLLCGCAARADECTVDGTPYCMVHIGQSLERDASCGASGDPLADGPYEGHDVLITCNANYCDCALDGVVVYGCAQPESAYNAPGYCGNCCFPSQAYEACNWP